MHRSHMVKLLCFLVFIQVLCLSMRFHYMYLIYSDISFLSPDIKICILLVAFYNNFFP